MIDYLLTAAVSLTAGVEAIASAFPALWPYKVWVALSILLLITLINLRGLRETGTMMAVPVYLIPVHLLADAGLWCYQIEAGRSWKPGCCCAATGTTFDHIPAHARIRHRLYGLTGIEAISNGVPAFRPPESKNAGRTLIVMAVLMGILFIGSLGLTQGLAVIAGPQETILSALARQLLGSGPAYFLIQVSTMLILAVAANTSFADFHARLSHPGRRQFSTAPAQRSG